MDEIIQIIFNYGVPTALVLLHAYKIGPAMEKVASELAAFRESNNATRQILLSLTEKDGTKQ